MTHFSDADGPAGIAAQFQAFEAVTHDLPGERSLSNSAALLRHGDALAERSDWVRPGIAVYGSAADYPLHSAADWGLKPTLSLSAKLVAVQPLETGDTVGYGSTLRQIAPCASAWWPAATPTATRATVAPVRL